MESRKEGNLKKKGHVRHNWKTRYFVLEDYMLSYYPNQSSTKRALGKLFLQGASIEMTKQGTCLLKTRVGSKKNLFLNANSPDELSEWMEAIKANIVSCQSAGSIKFSKPVIDFGLRNQTVELATAIYDDFEIVNLSTKKIKFKFEPMIVKSYDLTFDPNSGSLNKGERKSVKAKMIVNNPEIINGKAPVRIEGDTTAYLSFKCRGAGGVFGCDPTTLPQQMDNGFKVPTVLVQMKQSLHKNNAISQEGIFRLAGDSYDIKKVKESMNKNEFDLGSDVNTVATLMKIWFRELPVPILNVLSKESLMSASEKSVSIETYKQLPEPQKSLLDWLMLLLLEFSRNSSVNKMSLQNIAIVVAPNLYDPPDGNPMEGLVLSQKCVQFFHNVMVWKNEGEVSSPRNNTSTTSTEKGSSLSRSAPAGQLPPARNAASQRQLSTNSLAAIQRPPPPKTNHKKSTPQESKRQQLDATAKTITKQISNRGSALRAQSAKVTTSNPHLLSNATKTSSHSVLPATFSSPTLATSPRSPSKVHYSSQTQQSQSHIMNHTQNNHHGHNNHHGGHGHGQGNGNGGYGHLHITNVHSAPPEEYNQNDYYETYDNYENGENYDNNQYYEGGDQNYYDNNQYYDENAYYDNNNQYYEGGEGYYDENQGYYDNNGEYYEY